MWHMVRALRCFRCRSRAGKGRQMAGQLSLVESGKSVNNTDRQKALDAALAQIDRAFGKGSVMKLGSKEAMQVEAISTGSLGLDIALGVGGLPRGRVIEIYRPESSGQTTLALHAIRSEEHTSELQSLMRISYAALCLKKKNPQIRYSNP